MSILRSVGVRLRALFRKGRVEAEMEEELRFHLEQEIDKHLRAGLSPDEARRRAGIAFGGVERFKEQARDETGVRPLEDLTRDVRFAVRTLLKAPGVVLVTVSSLALGIGVSATVFAVGISFLFGDADFRASERKASTPVRSRSRAPSPHSTLPKSAADSTGRRPFWTIRTSGARPRFLMSWRPIVSESSLRAILTSRNAWWWSWSRGISLVCWALFLPWVGRSCRRRPK